MKEDTTDKRRVLTGWTRRQTRGGGGHDDDTHGVGSETQVISAEVLHDAHLACGVVHVEEAGSRVVTQHLVEDAAL